MTHRDDPTAIEPATNSKGAGGRRTITYAVVVALVVAFGALAADWQRRTDSPPIPPRTCLAVVIELGDRLEQRLARKAIASLEAELQSAGWSVRGPATFPLYLPPSTHTPRPSSQPAGANGGLDQGIRLKLPAVRSFSSTLSASDLASVKPYLFRSGGFFCPARFDSGGRYALIRALIPAEASDALRERTRTVLQRERPALGRLWSYSPALGFNDPQAEQVLRDAGFCPNTALVMVALNPKEDSWWKAERLQQLHDVAHRPHPQAESVTCPQDLLRYADAARRGVVSVGGPLDERHLITLLFQAQQRKVPLGVSEDARTCWVEVGTWADGEALFELELELSERFNSLRGVTAGPARKVPAGATK